jgi:hypothetical protein
MASSAGRVSERIEPPTRIVTPDTPIEQTRKLLCGGGKLPLPRDWRMWPNVRQAYREAMSAAAAAMPRYPRGRYHGRGIVIPGGGQYFVSAYVTLRMVRHVGCKLPAQVWYFGNRGELDERQIELLQKLGASCIDADALAAAHKVRILNGWELKRLRCCTANSSRFCFSMSTAIPAATLSFCLMIRR